MWEKLYDTILKYTDFQNSQCLPLIQLFALHLTAMSLYKNYKHSEPQR